VSGWTPWPVSYTAELSATTFGAEPHNEWPLCLIFHDREPTLVYVGYSIYIPNAAAIKAGIDSHSSPTSTSYVLREAEQALGLTPR
jgi:hypothetical protein